jgi:hypothetical protein
MPEKDKKLLDTLSGIIEVISQPQINLGKEAFEDLCSFAEDIGFRVFDETDDSITYKSPTVNPMTKKYDKITIPKPKNYVVPDHLKDFRLI